MTFWCQSAKNNNNNNNNNFEFPTSFTLYKYTTIKVNTYFWFYHCFSLRFFDLKVSYWGELKRSSIEGSVLILCSGSSEEELTAGSSADSLVSISLLKQASKSLNDPWPESLGVSWPDLSSWPSNMIKVKLKIVCILIIIKSHQFTSAPSYLFLNYCQWLVWRNSIMLLSGAKWHRQLFGIYSTFKKKIEPGI